MLISGEKFHSINLFIVDMMVLMQVSFGCRRGFQQWNLFCFSAFRRKTAFLMYPSLMPSCFSVKPYQVWHPFRSCQCKLTWLSQTWFFRYFVNFQFLFWHSSIFKAAFDAPVLSTLIFHSSWSPASFSMHSFHFAVSLSV